MVWIAGALLAYFAFRVQRPHMALGLIRDAFPSLVCPFVLLPGLTLLRTLRGGNPEATLRHESLCSLLAVTVLEGLVPLLGKGTADLADVAAFALGAVSYRTLSALGTVA
jgi:hypothetical protein